MILNPNRKGAKPNPRTKLQSINGGLPAEGHKKSNSQNEDLSPSKQFEGSTPPNPKEPVDDEPKVDAEDK